MVITATSIRLRSIWGFFRLSLFGLNIVRQLKTQPGFLKMRNGGFGYLHYTLTAWESEEAMRAFVKTGAHLTAMKSSRALSTEIRTYTFVADSMPSWKEARRLLAAHGKVLSFEPASH
jgi:hypothetical protein